MVHLRHLPRQWHFQSFVYDLLDDPSAPLLIWIYMVCSISYDSRLIDRVTLSDIISVNRHMSLQTQIRLANLFTHFTYQITQCSKKSVLYSWHFMGKIVHMPMLRKGYTTTPFTVLYAFIEILMTALPMLFFFKAPLFESFTTLPYRLCPLTFSPKLVLPSSLHRFAIPSACRLIYAIVVPLLLFMANAHSSAQFSAEQPD